MKNVSTVLSIVVVALVALDLFELRQLARSTSRLESLEARTAEPFHLGLGEIMGYQQRWVDKVGLAIVGGNWEAAAFYTDELKETAEDIVNARVIRENQNISELVKTALAPAIEGVADAVQRKDAAMFATRYSNLVGACNTCHAATKVPFIHVSMANDATGRWNQDFSAALQK